MWWFSCLGCFESMMMHQHGSFVFFWSAHSPLLKCYTLWLLWSFGHFVGREPISLHSQKPSLERSGDKWPGDSNSQDQRLQPSYGFAYVALAGNRGTLQYISRPALPGKHMNNVLPAIEEQKASWAISCSHDVHPMLPRVMHYIHRKTIQKPPTPQYISCLCLLGTTRDNVFLPPRGVGGLMHSQTWRDA